MVAPWLVTWIVLSSTGAGAADAPLTPSELFAKASVSVLEVHALDPQGASKTFGSAVVVAPEIIATNAHVLEGARSFEAKQGKRRWKATLVVANAERDYALLRVPGLRLPVPRTRPLDSLEIGARVFAIGSPRGFEATLSEGLVAGIRGTGRDRLIQISAAISPGSSGGGVFDDRARLIGLSTVFMKDSQNLNFAIPVDWVLEALAQASRGGSTVSAVHNVQVLEAARSGGSGSQATPSTDRCIGALNAYLVEVGPDGRAQGQDWIRLKRDALLPRASTVAVARTIGRKVDLWACQEAGLDAGELRLFQMFVDGALTSESPGEVVLCFATFQIVGPLFDEVAPRHAHQIGEFIGFRAGFAYAQLKVLMGEGGPELGAELVRRTAVASARLNALPEDRQSKVIELGLQACERYGIPVQAAYSMLSPDEPEKRVAAAPPPQASMERSRGDVPPAQPASAAWEDVDVGWKVQWDEDWLVVTGRKGSYRTKNVPTGVTRLRLPPGRYRALSDGGGFRVLLGHDGEVFRFDASTWVTFD